MAIVCHLYIGGQRGVDLSMPADVVTTVDEPGLTGGNTLSKGDSLVECLMAMVGFLTKGINHKDVAAFDKWDFFLTNGFHVGDVYQRALW